MVGVMMLGPVLPEGEHLKLPTTVKALPDGKTITLTVTRKPMPWLFWYGLAIQMAKQHLVMGAFVLLSVSVELDDPRIQFLLPVMGAMTADLDVNRAWSFAYPNYFQLFKGVVAEMDYPSRMCHQADRADGTRSLAGVRRRGRWGQASSRARHGRRALLAAEWMKLSLRNRWICQVAASQLEAMFLNRCRGRNEKAIVA